MPNIVKEDPMGVQRGKKLLSRARPPMTAVIELPVESCSCDQVFQVIISGTLLSLIILQGTVKGGKKTRQTEEEAGRQHQGMDRPGVRQAPEGSGKQEKWRKLVSKSSVAPKDPRG